MSHEVNDKLIDTIADEITSSLDKQDKKTWETYNEVAIEHGYHIDDDYKKIVQIMIDKEFDNRSR